MKESSLLSRLRLSFRRSTFKANALQAMASGAAFAWCFAASPPPLLAFVALAPFLLLLSQPKTLRLGWLFGAAYWLAAMPWIVATIETFGGVPPGLSHFLLLLMALYLGFESAIFAWLGAKIWRHGGGQGSLLRYAGLPALWVLLEAQRGFFFNGFPWNLAAYAWTDLPGALPLSAWVGALGVSFLLVFANVAVASAWETRRLAVPAACLLAVLLVLCLAGRFSRADAPTRGGIEVRLVQPNSAITRDSEQIERQYQRLLDLSAAECDPSREVLLVWPESAAWPYLYERSLRLRDDLARLSARGCHVLLSSASSEAAVGQEVGQEQGWRNVALLVGKLGVEAEYAKRRLVPWGEYVPLKSVLPFVGYLARNAGEFVPGKELGLMDIGGEKLAPSLAELFRGLLCDKVSDRWTVKQLEGWMTGAHFNPTLPSIPQRASRPLKFSGGEYLNKPALAHAMSRHWNEAITLIADGDFDNWFKRGFGDEKAPDKMLRTIGLANAYGPPSGVRDRTVSRYIIQMGGNLPICYKDIRTTLMGMGSMLSHYFERSERVQQIAEMMNARLPHAWLEEQPNLRPEQMQLRRSLEMIDKVIDRPAPGYGIERVLYELDRGTPCKSALIADYYVVNSADLLPAIDAAIPGAPHGTLPMDRHIAAFIAVSMKRSMDNELIGLANKADEIGYRTAILRLIAIVQRTHQNYDLPRLSQVIVEMLEPVIAAFHNTAMRDHIRGEIAKYADGCRFDEMLLILDGDGSLRRADNDGFAHAMQEFANLERGRVWLANGGLTETARVRGIAQRAAAITATLASSACLAGYGVISVLF